MKKLLKMLFGSSLKVDQDLQRLEERIIHEGHEFKTILVKENTRFSDIYSYLGGRSYFENNSNFFLLKDYLDVEDLWSELSDLFSQKNTDIVLFCKIRHIKYMIKPKMENGRLVQYSIKISDFGKNETYVSKGSIIIVK